MEPWFVVLGAMVLLARVGLAIYTAGLTRSKNAAGILLRSITDLSIAALAFWAIGGAIAMQRQTPFIGFHVAAAFGGTRVDSTFFVITALAPAAVVGAVGERSRFWPQAMVPLLLAGIVAPLAANWALVGWLGKAGFIDAAGASWVHVVGGVAALVFAKAVGPRMNKYNRDGSASMIPGHNLPLVQIGVFIALVGWLPYAAGVALPVAAGVHALPGLNVLLAAAAGTVASLVLSQARYGKPDVLLALLGTLGGLVSMTAGAGVMASHWAVLTGAVAGILVPMAAIWIDLLLRVDDPVGAVAVHAVGGAWGTIAAGLFAPAGMGKIFKHVGVQFMGLIAIAALSLLMSAALAFVLHRTVGLRAKEADEFDGLDLAEHDIGAYPDFQQNTIRSYHLREA